MELFNSFKDSFYENFIVDDRWKYLTDGLKNTLLITILAIFIGIILGFIVAIIAALFERSLVQVAALSCLGVLVTEIVMKFI